MGPAAVQIVPEPLVLDAVEIVGAFVIVVLAVVILLVECGLLSVRLLPAISCLEEVQAQQNFLIWLLVLLVGAFGTGLLQHSRRS